MVKISIELNITKEEAKEILMKKTTEDQEEFDKFVSVCGVQF